MESENCENGLFEMAVFLVSRLFPEFDAAFVCRCDITVEVVQSEDNDAKSEQNESSNTPSRL